MSGLVCLWRTTPRNINFKLLVLTPAPFNVANGFEGNRSQNKFSNSTLKGAAPTNLCKPNRHNFKLILRGLDGHRCLTRQRARRQAYGRQGFGYLCPLVALIMFLLGGRPRRRHTKKISAWYRLHKYENEKPTRAAAPPITQHSRCGFRTRPWACGRVVNN